MSYTPNDILQLTEPTQDFLCKLSANQEYGIEFASFRIQDYVSKQVLFEIREDGTCTEGIEVDNTLGYSEDSVRRIKYTFNEKVLSLPYLSTSLTFMVGSKPLSNFRMIERYYFQNRLIKTYDFTFGFCIPNSTNTWDAIYNIPTFDKELIETMVNHPLDTVSDSFYFVGDELVIHNKARYTYVRDDEKNNILLCVEPSSIAAAESKVDDETTTSQIIPESKNFGCKEKYDSNNQLTNRLRSIRLQSDSNFENESKSSKDESRNRHDVKWSK